MSFDDDLFEVLDDVFDIGILCDEQEGNAVKRRDLQKGIVDVDEKSKKQYSADASRKSREKKKRERAYLLKRNEFLEKEQEELTHQISTLKDELAVLEEKAYSRKRQHTYNVSLAIEHTMLQREVKKHRTVIGKIKDIMCTLSNDEEKEQSESEEELLLSLSALGVKSAVNGVLELCYSSVKNASNSWKTVPIDLHKGGPELSWTSTLSTSVSQYDAIVGRYELLPLGSSLETAERMRFRLDIHGFQIPEEKLLETMWVSFSRNDRHSMFAKFEDYFAGKFCLNFKINPLEVDFGKLKLSDDQETEPSAAQHRKWQWQGKNKIMLSRLIEETKEGKTNESVFITSQGRETLSMHGFDYYAPESVPEKCKGWILSNSLVNVAPMPQPIELKTTNQRPVETDTEDCLESTMYEGYIVHNLDSRPGRSNLTATAELELKTYGFSFMNPENLLSSSEPQNQDPLIEMFYLLTQILLESVDHSLGTKEPEVDSFHSND